MKKPNVSAFTLIELLIVIALLGVVATASMTVFFQGIKIFDRLQGAWIEEEQSIFFEYLTRDLKNSLKYSQVPWSSSENALSFPSLSQVIEKDGTSAISPTQVIYEWHADTQVIMRRQKAFPFTADDSSQVFVLRVKGVRFRLERENENEIPSFVTVSVDTGGEGSAGVLEKQISIPASFKLSGTFS